jgi:hypothetical protein
MTLVREQSPMEFFREQVERAREHQKVATSAFTEYYLVNLLASSIKGSPLPPAPSGFDETPLAVLYAQAMQSVRHERARLLRTMGDAALFVSGFFADSLSGKRADLSYYRSMGGRAYRHLSEGERSSAFGPGVFGELAHRFTQFADVLAEVSEHASVGSSRSLLSLYERWLQTGSPRAAALLAEQGLTPVLPVEGPAQ